MHIIKHKKILKKFLNKNVAISAADFFTETILFYIKLYNDKNKLNYKIKSEQIININSKKIRPDISIWKNEELIAFIECKTQLGWNRNDWKNHFTQRENIILQKYPNLKSYLVVMTSKNWGGFSENDSNTGKKYICISKIWPTLIDTSKLDEYILNPIESMLLDINSIF